MKILFEEKTLVSHSKKSSRYYWILETVTGTRSAIENDTDSMTASSEKGYIQDIKEEIL